MKVKYILPVAAVATLAMPLAASATQYHISGTVDLTVVAPAECVITGFTLPSAFSGPAANHGMKVGTIGFTSDVPCASPPTVALVAGSPFVLGGTTLPADLFVGPNDLAAGQYPIEGDATVGGAAPGLAPSNLKLVPVSPNKKQHR